MLFSLSIGSPLVRVVFRVTLAALACVILVSAPLPAQEDRDSDAARANHLANMKGVAASFDIFSSLAQKTKAKFSPEPVLRYADNTREIFESSLWIWGAGERPTAIMAIEFYTNEPRGPRWLYEIASLSTDRISVERGETLRWDAKQPGLSLRPLPTEEPVADKPIRRLSQMKELQRRFTASEKTPVEGRIELRPLTRPLYRYQDPSMNLIDGAIFSFVNGTNPEVLLILEAHRAPDGNSTWQYGMAQMTGAEVSGELDGKPVWSRGEADPPASRDAYVNGWLPAKSE